jgi:dCTP deaminase
MLLSDTEIRDALKKKRIVIEPFNESSLQPASYDLRVGKRLLVSGNEIEIDMENKHSTTLKAGQFALLTTLEKVTLTNDVAAHIGMKSYYVRKGIILLSGLQIDPGWDGFLVLGMYNASPRSITLDYQSTVCSIDFYSLAVPASQTFRTNEEQGSGTIPKMDKDYLRTLETSTLSEMSESVRHLSENVGRLSGIMYKVIVPLIVGIYLAILVGLFFVK